MTGTWGLVITSRRTIVSSPPVPQSQKASRHFAFSAVWGNNGMNKYKYPAAYPRYFKFEADKRLKKNLKKKKVYIFGHFTKDKLFCFSWVIHSPAICLAGKNSQKCLLQKTEILMKQRWLVGQVHVLSTFVWCPWRNFAMPSASKAET